MILKKILQNNPYSRSTAALNAEPTPPPAAESKSPEKETPMVESEKVDIPEEAGLPAQARSIIRKKTEDINTESSKRYAPKDMYKRSSKR